MGRSRSARLPRLARGMIFGSLPPAARGKHARADNIRGRDAPGPRRHRRSRKPRPSASPATSTPLEARARALPGEYDDNFHLTTADGARVRPEGDAPGAGARPRRPAVRGPSPPRAHRPAARPCRVCSPTRGGEALSVIAGARRSAADRLDAELGGGDDAGRGAPAHPRAAAQPGPVPGSDGRGPPGLLAPRGGARARVGPRPRRLDPRLPLRHRGSGAAGPRGDGSWPSTRPRSSPRCPACGAA